MRVCLLFWLLLIGAPLLHAQGQGAAASSRTTRALNALSPPAGNAENGKKIFSAYGCYQCHGYAGQGGAGARLAPRPIPFEGFSRYVRRPLDQMPPYTSKVVSDQELADIYAFLLTIPAPPAANSIPMLAR
jgi:mono/diheme cytochrome c family protein